MKTKKLGECAQVIRCQLPRSRDENVGWLPCREITLAEVDSLTGFVTPNAGETVWAELNPETKQSKYLIKNGDSLISFRGTTSTLGRVGYFWEEDDRPAMTGQSLAIIRPIDVDSIWLYYYLARATIREHFSALATGGRLLALNLNVLRDLSISTPSMDKVAAIHQMHAGIVQLAMRVREAQDGLCGLLKDVENFLARNR